MSINTDEILSLVKSSNSVTDFIKELKSKLSDKRGIFFKDVGLFLYDQSLFDFAIETLSLALNLFNNTTEDVRNIVECNIALGMAYFRTGKLEEALRSYEYGMDLSSKMGLSEESILCNIGLGIIFRNVRKFNNAINCHEKALQLSKGIGNSNLLNYSLSEIKKDYQLLHDYKYKKIIDQENNRYVSKADFMLEAGGRPIDPHEAIKRHQHIIDEFKTGSLSKREHPELVSFVYDSIARCYGLIGEYRKAIEYSEKSLKSEKERNNLRGIAHTHCQLGWLLHSIGDNDGLLKHCKEGANTAEKTFDPGTIIVCYASLSQAYRLTGELKKGLDYSKSALQLARTTMIKFDILGCMEDVGEFYRDLKEFDKAEKYCQGALSIAREINDKKAENHILFQLGNLYRNFNKLLEAIEYIELCIRNEQAKNTGLLADCYSELAFCWSRLGNKGKAMKYFKDSLEYVKKIGNDNLLSNIYFAMGDTYFTDKNLEKAYLCFDQSIKSIESIGSDFIQEQHKIAFYGGKSVVYQYMIHLCLLLEKRKEAMEYVERSKSRAFLDILAKSYDFDPVIRIKELQNLYDQAEKLVWKLRAIQISDTITEALNIYADSVEIDSILNELNELYSKIGKRDAEYVSMRKGTPLNMNNIKELLQ